MTRVTSNIHRAYRGALNWAAATEENCLVAMVVLVYAMVFSNLLVAKVFSLV